MSLDSSMEQFKGHLVFNNTQQISIYLKDTMASNYEQLNDEDCKTMEQLNDEEYKTMVEDYEREIAEDEEIRVAMKDYKSFSSIPYAHIVEHRDEILTHVQPIQLAAAVCGCLLCKPYFGNPDMICVQKFDTLDDVKLFYADERNKNQIAHRMHLFEKKMTADANELRMKSIMLNLPTESKKGKAKRLLAESIAKREAKFANIRQKNKDGKSLHFGHRRNGGGKRRKRVSDTDDALKLRRALHRKETRERKKVEEVARQLQFANAEIPIVKVEMVAQPEYIQPDDEDEYDSDIDDDERKLIEEAKKDEIDEKQRVMELQIAFAMNRTDDKLESVYEAEAKPLPDPNQRWSMVGKSKKEKKEKKIIDIYSYSPEPGTKSRVCKMIEMGKPCRYGDKCSFAHTMTDLTPKRCRFGERCRQLDWTCNGFVNKMGRRCSFIHPKETRDNYQNRLNLFPKVSPTIESLSEPICQVIPKPVEYSKLVAPSNPKPVDYSKLVAPSNPKPVDYSKLVAPSNPKPVEYSKLVAPSNPKPVEYSKLVAPSNPKPVDYSKLVAPSNPKPVDYSKFVAPSNPKPVDYSKIFIVATQKTFEAKLLKALANGETNIDISLS
jgi:hypothetical protein